MPRAQAIRIGGEAAELGDRAHRGADVAGREQRLAPVERQIGARGIGRVEPRERAFQKTCRRRQVVARERPPARGRQMARGPLAEGPALRVDRAELAQMLVGLLEVPAERLVVLDGPRGARLQPVGEAAVQLRAGVLEQAPVGRVADQHVMEAQHRLAEEPAGVGFDELAAPQRLEPRVEIADLARQELGQRSPREVPPDHRGPLQDRALLRTQPLDAGGQQRVDGGRHLEIGELDARGPAVAFPFERAVVDQHADQLADEERIALAGGQHAPGDRGRQRLRADHVRGQPGRRAGVEPGERHHVADQATGRRQRRARVAQLGPRGSQHQQRHVAAPLHEVLDQVEQQRLRPLDVVDRQHHRPHGRERGEPAADDEEDLLR